MRIKPGDLVTTPFTTAYGLPKAASGLVIRPALGYNGFYEVFWFFTKEIKIIPRSTLILLNCKEMVSAVDLS